MVSYALKTKKHLMINKKYVSREFSFMEVILETLGVNWGKLDLVRSYTELCENITKLVDTQVTQ